MGITLVRQDRADVAAVVDGWRRRGGSAGEGGTPCEHDESKQVSEKGAEAGHRGEFRESEERGKWTRRVRGWQSLTRRGRAARSGLAALSCGAVLVIECALGRSFVACMQDIQDVTPASKQAPTAELVKISLKAR